MAADPSVLLGGEASGPGGKLRPFVQIHKTEGPLAGRRGEGMGDFVSHPAPAGVFSGIGKVDAVSRICGLISFFGVFLNGEPHLIQAGFSSHPSCLGRQGAAHPFGGVDPASLGSGEDLYKRRSCCFGERKYFSPASSVKISDKVHPAPGLGDMEIFAVKHLPFHKIPQSVQRMEDGRKRPAPVMVKQAGYIFKEQIRRSFGRSHTGNFKEQRTSGVCEPTSVSSN